MKNTTLRRVPPSFFVPLALLSLMLLAPAALTAQGITAEQIVELRQVTATAMSPDGDQVAFTLSVPRDADEEPGGAYSELWVVPAEGGEPRPVVERPLSASAPAWSPGGGTLAFAARLPEHDERPQVYGVEVEADEIGEIRPLTRSPRGVMAFAFAPDGEEVAYTAREPLPEEVRERRQRGFDMEVAGEDERHVRLWVEGVTGEDRRVLTPPDVTVRDFVWAPDGGRLAVQATEDVGADADLMFRRIHVVPADGTAADEEMEVAVPSEGKLGPMAWAPDGQRLAYLGATSFSDPLPQSVFVADPDEEDPEPLNLTPDYEASVEWLAWPETDALLFAAVEGTRTVLNQVPAEGGELREIFGHGPEIVRSLSLDARALRFATAAHTRAHPPEVYVGSVPNARLERVTHHNPWLEDVELAPQQVVEWTGPDDLRIEGVLVRPLEERPAGDHPLAVLPHGGPEAISIDGWNTRPLYPVQLLAANGYAVLKPNYRGSGGRGVAFASGNHRDLGGKEFDDVLAGIDHVVELGLADPNRVGISGTSYGGYFSAWGGTRHSDRFAAAITFAGLSNWISFTGTTDIPVEMSVVHWDQWWFDNPGQNWDRSPVAWLQESDTPILVAHGKADERVHPEQSLQLHQFLELKGIPTGLVLYPREPHGLLERAHQIDFMERVLDWFDRHVRDRDVDE